MLDYDHWVFDLDGTLTVHQHDFDGIRAELGIPQGRLILEHLDRIGPAAAAPLRARLDAWEAGLAGEARVAAGAAEALSCLSARGARVGILTRNTRDNALATLETVGLARYFEHDAVLGRDEAAPKPAPDGILTLLRQWGADAARAIMVGDFHLDLRAGRNAGVATAHVAERAAPAWPALTDHRFHSMQQLAEALLTGTATHRG